MLIKDFHVYKVMEVCWAIIYYLFAIFLKFFYLIIIENEIKPYFTFEHIKKIIYKNIYV